MTRPELPPGWMVRPNPFDPRLLTSVRNGYAFSGGIDRGALVAEAWASIAELETALENAGLLV